MRRAAALLAVLAVSASFAAGQTPATPRSSETTSPQGTLTPADYSRRVAEVAQRLDQAAVATGKAGKTGQPSAAAAQRALGALPEQVRIQPPGGPPLQVDNRALLAALRDDVRRGPRGIRAAAVALRNLHDSLAVRPASAPERARATLAEVLRRREFRPSMMTRLERRIAQLAMAAVIAIGRALGWLIDRVPGVPAIPGPARRFILWIVLGIVAAAALFLVVTLILRIGRRGARTTLLVAPEPEPLKPHTAWLAEAEAASQAHDYQAAVRALHMAALMRLDAAGIIRYADSRTDRRFVQTLREGGNQEVAEALAGLNRLFAVIWYGLAPAGPQEYAAARGHWEQLEAVAAT